MTPKLRYALPAGVQVDTPSLVRLVTEQKVSRYEVEDGALTLSMPPRGPGEPLQASFRVAPTGEDAAGLCLQPLSRGTAGTRLVRASVHVDGALNDGVGLREEAEDGFIG
jgi:hypothetical protein